MGVVGFPELADCRIVVFADFRISNSQFLKFYNSTIGPCSSACVNHTGSFTAFRISPAGSDARKAAQLAEKNSSLYTWGFPESIQNKLASRIPRGRGGCMGRSSAIVRLAFTFVVSLVAALTSCSSASPTKNTVFPVPANIVLAPANTVSLDVGSATQNFHRQPPEQQTHCDHDSGYVPFQQYRRLDHSQLADWLAPAPGIR